MAKSMSTSVSQSGPQFLSGQQFMNFERAQRQLRGRIPELLAPMTGASFESDLQRVGGTPANFTDIPQSAYLSPQMLSEMQNSLFAEGAARTGAAQERIREGAIPGATSRFGITEQLAGAQRFNDALATRESTRLAGEYAPTINRLAGTAQTNVEAQRAADDRNRRALAIEFGRLKFGDRDQRLNALVALLQPGHQSSSFSQTSSGGGGVFSPGFGLG